MRPGETYLTPADRADVARHRMRRRMIRFGAVLAVLATFCLGAMTHAAWDGTNSTKTLGFREALRTIKDRSAAIEQRETAARSAYALSLEAADVFKTYGPEVESYAGESETWRREASEAWGK